MWSTRFWSQSCRNPHMTPSLLPRNGESASAKTVRAFICAAEHQISKAGMPQSVHNAIIMTNKSRGRQCQRLWWLSFDMRSTRFWRQLCSIPHTRPSLQQPRSNSRIRPSSRCAYLVKLTFWDGHTCLKQFGQSCHVMVDFMELHLEGLSLPWNSHQPSLKLTHPAAIDGPFSSFPSDTFQAFSLNFKTFHLADPFMSL